MKTLLHYVRKALGSHFASREDAQALIFFAVVSGVLALTMGLAIEGGRVFVEYRRLQAAADMAAVVGAQKLPCGLTQTTCISAAESLACQTAASNGFSNCSNGAGPGALVPPVTCSPYDFLDYGNDSGDPSPYGNSSCKTTNAPVSSYDYIEVQLSNDLGVVPIFDVPVVLSAHAVARHGVPSTKDYAVAQLDRNTRTSFSIGGNFNFFVNGATFANGTFAIANNAGATGCDGGFFTAQNTADPGTEKTYSGGIPGFAPPECYLSDGVTRETVSVPDWDSSLPPITDPYCSSVSAPYLTTVGTDCNGKQFGGTTYSNCPDCTKLGWYYDPAVGWTQGGDIVDTGAGRTIEMFPGVYGSFSLASADQVYMNPGVYTFTGAVSFDKGNVCLFGAPICKSGSVPGGCGDTSLSWTPGTAAGSNSTGNQWYYKCSPYGFRDTALPRPASATGGAATVACSQSPQYGPSCVAPTWWDDSLNNGAGGASTIPLNGMTWQFVSPSTHNGGIGGTGAGNSGLAYYLASPNPCPGTGSGWAAASTAVSFNNGDPAAQYTYGASSTDTLAVTRYGTGYQSPIVSGWGSTGSASQIYPSMDLKTSGECTPDNLEMWPGEMGGKGQHLHFAMFDRYNNLLKFAGNQGQSFMGIMYFPAAGSTVDVTGAGSSGGGIPFILGQLIGWDITFGGSGTVDLIYRPCDKQNVCATGLGTQLIQ